MADEKQTTLSKCVYSVPQGEMLALLKKVRADALEEAAKEAEKALGGYLCPYGRDKPGDPTWNHTDKDICPVCRVPGDEALFKCHDTASGRIVAAIRSLV